MTLTDRLQRSIKMRAGKIVLRRDVASFGSPSQVSEAMQQLQKLGLITRIGTGVYAKTRVSSVTGSTIPAGTLEGLAAEALQRLGADVRAGAAAAAYNAGETTQIPGTFVVNTGSKRISRKIAVGGRRVVYENDYGRAVANP